MMQQKFIALAIDKDRSSQSALKWVAENLVSKGQTLLLIHVKLKVNPPASASGSSSTFTSSSIPRLNLISDGINQNGNLNGEVDPATKEMFLPFRVYCMRKDIQCQEIMLEDEDIVKAITEFVSRVGVEILVLGASAKGGIFRFKYRDIPASVLKGVPNFCSVYIVSKGKISSTRSASRPAPTIHPLRQQILHQGSNTTTASVSALPPTTNFKGSNRSEADLSIYNLPNDYSSIKSPFSHRQGPNGMAYQISSPDTDISFVSSGRQSFDMPPSFADSFESRLTAPRLSGFSDIDSHGYESYLGRRSVDIINTSDLSYFSDENKGLPASQTMDDVEAEMRRLKQELRQTIVKYGSTCKEPLTENQKETELQRWKMEEQQRLEEARLAEEALALAEKVKAKSRVAFEHAEAAQRIAELEAEKRINIEMKALKEAEDKSKVQNRMTMSNVKYRKYTIEEIEVATNYFDKSLKVGEGGYGPVYKCNLDHTPAAVKVLRPDAAQGRSQFQQEVEVLSCIRHPNMVLLLGACPEYGCLVYEYLSNGSLEDRLFRRGNTPPLSWQQRFLIAAEISTGLLFLHQTKPEPLVHRDLKPANILLDRNFVGKISDVGLARLVPASVADAVTQYHMTSTAGTFCYIDPEYQQTGMLGIKSDTYSLGIIFLQILTGKPPMGLTHHVERAIERETFAEMLDSSVPNWPFEEALGFAKLALKCSELRRKDRPDLGKVVLPELEKLRELAEEKMASPFTYNACATPPLQNQSQSQSQVSMPRDDYSYPNTGQSGYESSMSQTSKTSSRE